MSDYLTWYEFKKDLERLSHRRIEPSVWLEVKPKAPLPWSYLHLRRSHSKLLDLEKRNYSERLAYQRL